MTARSARCRLLWSGPAPGHELVVALAAVRRSGAGRRLFFVVSPHETLSTFTAIAGIFVLIDGVIAISPRYSAPARDADCSASSASSAPSPGSSYQEAVRDPRRVHAHPGRLVRRRRLVRAVTAFASAEDRGGNLLVAGVDLIAGIVILAWPDLSLSTLAVIIGIVLILPGGLFIVAGWQLTARSRADTGPGAPARRGVRPAETVPLTSPRAVRRAHEPATSPRALRSLRPESPRTCST